MTDNIIEEKDIVRMLDKTKNNIDPAHIRDILTKAKELQGLDLCDIATLSKVNAPELLLELFETAKYVKETIYGQRMVVFAPLYISNLCKNECLYCAFRATNKEPVLCQDKETSNSFYSPL